MAILIGKEIKSLTNSVNVNAFSASAQAVYTAPSGSKVVITKVVLRCTAAVGVTVPCTAKVEINPAAGDLFAAEVLVGVTAVDDQWAFSAEARGLVVPAGAQVDVTITNAATGTSQTLAVDTIGYIVY